MYKDGLAGLTVDYVKAKELFLKAAEQKAYLKYSDDLTLANLGVAEAENSLGTFYQRGMGVDRVLIFTFAIFNQSFKFKFAFETKTAMRENLRCC